MGSRIDRSRALGIFDIRLSLDNIINPVHRSHTLLKRIIELAQLLYRVVQHQHGCHEGEKRPDGGGAVDHPGTTIPDNQGDTESGEKLHDGR